MSKPAAASRDVFGEVIIELAEKDKEIITMDCDLGGSTRAARIREVDPDRFIEMGIAEQDMVSTAAGMARMGKKVFANSFAVFVTGRSFDQIRQQVALPKANVKICGSSAGLTQGPDGATHQSVLDVALMRNLPNMTVFVPGDEAQTRGAVIAAVNIIGPVYIRLSRFPVLPFSDGIPFEAGKGQILRRGKGLLLCSTGPVTGEVIKASAELEFAGLDPTIACFHTIKPFDEELIIRLSADHDTVITVEEHNILGGLGTTVAEVMAEHSLHLKKFKRLGVCDHFGESGTAEELLCKYKLDSAGLLEQIMTILNNG